MPTPFDYAGQIVSLDREASDYRHQVERVLRLFAADELSRVAQRIDCEYLSNQIFHPSQAAQILRDEGAQHLNQT